MAGRGGKSPKGARAKPEDLEELLSHSTTEHQRDRLSSLHRAEAHLTSWLNNPGGTFRGDSPENMFVTEQGKEQDEDGQFLPDFCFFCQVNWILVLSI